MILGTVVGSVSALSRFAFNLPVGAQRASRDAILRLWEEGSFAEAHRAALEALASRPMDYFLLTMRGFSAYQVGVAQANRQIAAVFFEDSIKALRRAMLLPEAETDGRLFYVLGKAYFYMGEDFADLTIRYLEQARALGHPASDIPEFLGLAYASIGDYRSSVIAFAEALEVTRPSELLLFHIAESYVGLGELYKARAYLMRSISVSMDSRVTIRARLFLSDVLRMLEDFDGASAQLMNIMEETGENAEARFRLGELHSQRGDVVRARAEWRLALNIDPAHLGARARLAL